MQLNNINNSNVYRGFTAFLDFIRKYENAPFGYAMNLINKYLKIRYLFCFLRIFKFFNSSLTLHWFRFWVGLKYNPIIF